MKIALFTNKENADPLWPVWLDYYTPHVDHIETISLRENNPRYSPGAFAREASLVQHNLLKSFDVVVYADIDEFLIPDPNKYDGLRDYIEQHWNELPRATGYQLIHNGESEIDLSKPLLSQRGWWAADDLYGKCLITSNPLKWSPGFHYIEGITKPNSDPDLILLHVLYIDDKLAHERLKVTYPKRSITQVREKISTYELSAVPERFKIL